MRRATHTAVVHAVAAACVLATPGCAEHSFDAADPVRSGPTTAEADAGIRLTTDVGPASSEQSAGTAFAMGAVDSAEASLPAPAVLEPRDPCLGLAQVFDFERGAEGFEHAPSDGFEDDPWDLGSPVYMGCHSGQACFATNLIGEYGACTSAHLMRTLDLSACAGSGRRVELRFWHYFSFQSRVCPSFGTGGLGCGFVDGGTLQLSTDGGESWGEANTSLDYAGQVEMDGEDSRGFWGSLFQCRLMPVLQGLRAWSGEIEDGDWMQVRVPLDDAQRVEDFALRFLMGSDGLTHRSGWLIDDVEVWVE